MSDEPCKRCGHSSGAHIVAATVFCTLQYDDGPKEIPAGGHMYCPEAGCECHGTWSLPDAVVGFDVVARLTQAGPLPPDEVRRIRGH